MITPELLLAGVLSALALNASAAWIRHVRAPDGSDGPDGQARQTGLPPTLGRLRWRLVSAALQTLAIPLVFVLVAVDPHVFADILASGASVQVALTVGIPLLVLLMLWRLIVEIASTLAWLRRQRREATLGRRVLAFARARGRGARPLIVPPESDTVSAPPDLTHAHD